MEHVKIGTAALRRALFDAGPDAVVCVDAEGRVIAANPRAAELFGFELEEFAGRAIETIIYEDPVVPETSLRLYDDPQDQSLSGGMNFVGRRKDGSEFPAGISLSPQQSREGPFIAAIIADLTELRIAEQQLRESEERYHHLIENTPDGYLTSVNNVITNVNPSAVRMLGADSASQVIGLSLYDLLQPEDIPAIGQASELAPRGMVALPFVNSTFTRLDGVPVEVELGSVRIRTDDGRAVAQTIMRDLSAKKQAEELRIRALAAEQSERMKSNLVSTVSHELRTPLTAVRGYATTVIDYAGQLDKDEIVEYMKGIDAAAQHLEKIVSDLLTLSRIEGGVYRLDPTDFDAEDFLRGAVTAYHVAHPNHPLSIERRVEHPLVHADSMRVLQVLHNLLDNARKYGGEGNSTRIAIDRDGDELKVTVSDPGEGVEEAALENIFQPFVRGPGAHKSEEPGSGLGLAVCKGIVEAHGGRIWASLPPDGGFAISFTLPAAA